MASAAARRRASRCPGIIRANAADATINKWIDEFQPSTLSRDEQIEELTWFQAAAKPFKGMDIKVVSETIDTHVYESQTLAKAFSEITGINLTHDLIQEGDVIEKLQTQMQSDQNIYDAYINDSDLIGTHFRYDKVVPLTDWMAGEGKDVTLPTLDVDDFMGKSFTTGPGRQALPAARPAVRQPLLVPLRLVHRPADQGASSRRSRATTSACRSTGRPTRTSPTSSPTT